MDYIILYNFLILFFFLKKGKSKISKILKSLENVSLCFVLCFLFLFFVGFFARKSIQKYMHLYVDGRD